MNWQREAALVLRPQEQDAVAVADVVAVALEQRRISIEPLNNPAPDGGALPRISGAATNTSRIPRTPVLDGLAFLRPRGIVVPRPQPRRAHSPPAPVTPRLISRRRTASIGSPSSADFHERYVCKICMDAEVRFHLIIMFYTDFGCPSIVYNIILAISYPQIAKALVPCGHACMCSPCCDQLVRRHQERIRWSHMAWNLVSMAHLPLPPCPICRADVVQIISIYL